MSRNGAGANVSFDSSGDIEQPGDLIPDVDSKFVVGDATFDCDIKDLIEEKILGTGAYGAVYRMKHEHTGYIMAVKRICASVDNDGRKRLRRELQVCMNSKHCPHTITFYGAKFGEGDVWICMEMMDRSLHDLYKLVYDRLKQRIPENIVGRMAESTLKALHFLKDKLKVLHRDVKPSNILINRAGEIKLCDFGIAGELVNSYVQTNIGCRPYLAPERINPDTTGAKYDQRSDVWSYGITVYELAVGKFPYPSWTNVFDQLDSVVKGKPPRILPDAGLSERFTSFVHRCLTHAVKDRPRFDQLLEDEFILFIEHEEVDVAGWYEGVLAEEARQS